MEYTNLGKTDLKVSVAGLGCGGPSRLGMRNDPQSEQHAIGLIRLAMDLGVNFLDTAQTYGTEPVVGKAIAGLPRESLVISTKKTLPAGDHDPAGELKKGLEQSLKLIGTDYIDIYHLHGVEPKDYSFCKERLIPVMRQLKEEGKIRFIGVTEAFVVDQSHTMLQQSLRENMWDVIMVGFNLLNPSARTNVFPLSAAKGVGTLDMFAVRRALSQPQQLRKVVGELIDKKVIAQDAVNRDDPLDFVLRESDAETLPEAAYRFCRHEPGVDLVLTGTGSAAHLKENIAAILKPPLPKSALNKLNALFGKLDFLTGN